MKRWIYCALIMLTVLAPSRAVMAQEESAMDRVEEPEAAETRNCLPMSQIRRIETVDDQTLLFHMHGDRKYVNHLPYRCPGLKQNSFVHETSMNSYCDLDIISVVDLTIGMRMGSCPLGEFEKVEGPLELE